MDEFRANHEIEPLSPQGQARREAMLGQLVGEMSVIRRRRRVRRAALSTTAIVLLLFGVFRYADFNAPDNAVTSNHQLLQPTAPFPREQSTIRHVQTDPTVLDRFRAAPAPIIVRIDDAQLIETLVKIGRPAGIIQFGERVALSAPVTDDELRANPDSH